MGGPLTDFFETQLVPESKSVLFYRFVGFLLLGLLFSLLTVPWTDLTDYKFERFIIGLSALLMFAISLKSLIELIYFRQQRAKATALRIDENGVFDFYSWQNSFYWANVDSIQREGASAIIHLKKPNSTNIDTHSIENNQVRNLYEDEHTIRLSLNFYRHPSDEIWKTLNEFYHRHVNL